MMSTFRSSRFVLAAAVVLALGSTVGCSWFKHKSDYQKSVENAPLEVPPDLTLPDTSASTQLPPASSLGAGGSPAAGSGLMVPGSAKDVWAKLGDILAGLDGVTVTGKAEALSSYDLSYEGQNFLLRVEDMGGQSRLSAISPDGQIITGGSVGALLRAVKDRLQ